MEPISTPDFTSEASRQATGVSASHMHHLDRDFGERNRRVATYGLTESEWARPFDVDTGSYFRRSGAVLEARIPSEIDPTCKHKSEEHTVQTDQTDKRQNKHLNVTNGIQLFNKFTQAKLRRF